MAATQTEALVDPSEVRLAEGATPPESRGTGVKDDIRHTWRLIVRYFRNDLWVGLGLLSAKIALGGLSTYAIVNIQLRLSQATSALADRDAGAIPTLLLSIFGIAFGMLAAQLTGNWVRLYFRMRTRTVLTEGLLAQWFSDTRYYHLERESDVDHPEQRIQEDLFIFVERALDIIPGLITGLFPIYLYAGKLWELSQPLPLDAIGLPYVLHGSLVFFAIAFSVAWTFVTHWLGRSLTTTEITRQGLEAEFRQQMGTVRETGEAIAFQRGGPFEAERAGAIFSLIRKNWTHYSIATLKVVFASSFPGQLFMLLPIMLCAPYVLDGRMKIGDVQFVGAALTGVYMALGILIQSYAGLAILRSAVSRLRYFEEQLGDVPAKGDLVIREVAAKAFVAEGLTVHFPDGRPMVEIGDLILAAGARALIKGPSGAGKSTFLRAIAGLWPHGRGTVQAPADARIHFIPQRAYMPDGTLAALLAYPGDPGCIADATYAELLDRLGLGHLTGRLHDHAAWKRILSPGEQQRIAAARAILADPEFLFVDEATSALDLHSEETFYSLLAERLPQAAIISIAHRPTVEQYHDLVIEFSNGKSVVRPRSAAAGN